MNGGKRHVPLRSCVVCGKKTAKRELIRIVATPQGAMEVDPTGRLPGRGAYVCADGNCAQGALRRSRIDYALRKKLSNDDWTRVTSAIEAAASPK
jgi:predicted RNA-binding protein YlxR (DUF448 family)